MITISVCGLVLCLIGLAFFAGTDMNAKTHSNEIKMLQAKFEKLSADGKAIYNSDTELIASLMSTIQEQRNLLDKYTKAYAESLSVIQSQNQLILELYPELSHNVTKGGLLN